MGALLGALVGYRTYITIAVMVLHQVLKANGLDIPSETLSLAADSILGGLAIVFKALADKRNLNTPVPK